MCAILLKHLDAMHLSPFNIGHFKAIWKEHVLYLFYMLMRISKTSEKCLSLVLFYSKFIIKTVLFWEGVLVCVCLCLCVKRFKAVTWVRLFQARAAGPFLTGSDLESTAGRAKNTGLSSRCAEPAG